MHESNKVLLVGCGAVGTMCAFTLHNSRLVEVTAVLRSNFDIVESLGFHIKSVDHGEIWNWKPQHLARNVSDALKYGPFDYIVVAMKSLPDVYSIPAIIEPAVAAGLTTIVLIQNGIGIEQPFIKAFPENIILSGVTMIGCELNGCDVLHNDPDILNLGHFPRLNSPCSEREDAISRFSELYESGGAKCVVVEDILWHRWRKLVWNAPFNSICALTNVDSGTILDTRCKETLIRPAMNEVVSLAAATGYVLPDDIQEQMMNLTDKEVRLRPSMQIDAIKQRPMEIEVILGCPLRIAEKLNRKMPVLTVLYELLKAKSCGFRDTL